MSAPQFKILSIDGGGIKGIIPCTILKTIEDKTGSNISELFNLVAGTSTGGIIALGISKPDVTGVANAYSAADMLNLYVKEGGKIFAKRKKDFWSRVGSLLDITKQIATNNYTVEGFEELLGQRFGDVSLSSSLVKLLITSYDISTGRPFYFSTRLAKDNPHEDITMREIARSTSAAPTFFEPSRVRFYRDENLAFVDGGVFANNPAILAYGEAKELWKAGKRFSAAGPSNTKGFSPVVMADDNDYPFYMLSIGCGHAPSAINYADADKWHAAEWMKPLLTDIFMRSVEESTHYTMQHLMPPYLDGRERYQRLELELPREYTKMDDASEENIARLVNLANEFVEENDKLIDSICEIIGN